MLFGDVQQVIQVEWQSLAAFGSIVGGAIVGGAKIIANQLATNSAETKQRHAENRADALEARTENRMLSQSILSIQGQTVGAIGALQTEIQRIIERLDGDAPAPHPQPGSKAHPALAHLLSPPGPPK